MKNIMHFLFCILCLSSGFTCSNSTNFEIIENRLKKQSIDIETLTKTDAKLNHEIAFLIDMKIHSGYNRFFVYNLKTKTILDKGLVAHGSGSETTVKDSFRFSNVSESNCTSLGKYTIGKSYFGTFGKAYKLHGLDKSNNNAFVRNIVLHKYDFMPYKEQEFRVINSLGCPMVNEKFYKRLEKIIDKSKSNIILKIYY